MTMVHQRKAVRIGADVGGAFTDCGLEVGSTIRSTRLLIADDTPEHAIVEGVERVTRQVGISPGAIDSVTRGTTLANNASIERRGAHRTLITTKSFRDDFEMRTENCLGPYDLNMTLPPPSVSREDGFTVLECRGASSEMIKPLSEREFECLPDTNLLAEHVVSPKIVRSPMLGAVGSLG